MFVCIVYALTVLVQQRLMEISLFLMGVVYSGAIQISANGFAQIFQL